MRFILTAAFAAALIAAPALSMAAPGSIDDCEKIQAADAYNQCLALFGPVARGHGAAGDSVSADGQDAEAAASNANDAVATAGDSGRSHRHASRHGWVRHSWARHSWERHSWARHSLARHGHWRRTGAADAPRHGKATTMAFSVVSGRTRLR